MKENREEKFNVAIVGGGIVGTSLLYTLAKYSGIDNICLIEKYKETGLGVSKHNHNSQTLHQGDIETNYSEEKAGEVKKASGYLLSYLKSREKEELYKPLHKMVLAVGEEEVFRLEERFEWVRKVFPQDQLLHGDKLSQVEPKITEGREPGLPLCAIYNPEGHVVDYGKVAQSFAKEALESGKNIKFLFGNKIGSARKRDGFYELLCEYTGKIIKAEFVVFASGASSLRFARSLGYRREWILLPVAGNFLMTKKLVNGKVYTMQIEGMPFAALHADPAFSDFNETHFGPLSKALPMLERQNYETVGDFFKLVRPQWDHFVSILNIISQKKYFAYIIKQLIYDIPLIGRRVFVSDAKKIIPSIKLGDIKPGKQIAGIRPQILNTKTRELEMGEARIKGDNILFDITPSPGASVSLNNARTGAKYIAECLGDRALFYEEKFERDHSI